MFPNETCPSGGVDPVSNTLRVSTQPEFFTTIEGVKGVVLNSSLGSTDLLSLSNVFECSHLCQTDPECAAYTWIDRSPEATKTVLQTLKSILGISPASDDESVGACHLFQDEQAQHVHKIGFDRNGMSGMKMDKRALLAERVRAVLAKVDPVEPNEFSSKALRVSFGGAAGIDGWLTDSGEKKDLAFEDGSVGSFGWNCDLTADVRDRRAEGAFVRVVRRAGVRAGVGVVFSCQKNERECFGLDSWSGRKSQGRATQYVPCVVFIV